MFNEYIQALLKKGKEGLEYTQNLGNSAVENAIQQKIDMGIDPKWARESTMMAMSGGMSAGTVKNAAQEIPGLTSLLGKASPNSKAIETINKARDMRLSKIKAMFGSIEANKLRKAKELIGK